MTRRIAVGIDIGTHRVRVVIGEHVRTKDTTVRRIIGTGEATSNGLRYGYIVGAPEVTESLQVALAQAQRTANVPIKRAYLSIGGASLEGVTSTGSSIISRADAEITDMDVERAVAASRDALPKQARINRHILHTIPISFSLDGKEVLGRPEGMRGVKIEAKTLFVTCLSQHLEDLLAAVEEVGIEVEDVLAAPIAASVVNLTKTQKIAGVVLANVGAETVSVVVYENDTPISLKVFPIGSTDITNDIALGFQIPIDEAETVKTKNTSSTYSRKELDTIIEARLADIFELIQIHLKKIGKSGLLPAGIVLTGGGAGLSTIDELAKVALKLPAAVAEVTIGSGTKGVLKDASWSVAYGLALIGLAGGGSIMTSTVRAKKAGRALLGWFKQFLP